MKPKSPPEQLPPQDEPHQIKVIRLKKADRAILEAMAAAYRVTDLTHFIQGILAALDERYDGSQVLFRMYEKSK